MNYKVSAILFLQVFFLLPAEKGAPKYEKEHFRFSFGLNQDGTMMAQLSFADRQENVAEVVLHEIDGKPNDIEIISIIVKEEYWRLGIETIMILFLIEFLRESGIKKIRVESLPEMINFYKKSNFELTEEVCGDCLVMELVL